MHSQLTAIVYAPPHRNEQLLACLCTNIYGQILDTVCIMCTPIQLEIDVNTVQYSLCGASKLKLKLKVNVVISVH